MSRAPTEQEIDEFFKRHTKDAYSDPAQDFWDMSPLCPSSDTDAFAAFQQLHRQLQQWVDAKRYEGKIYKAQDIELWDAKTALSKGHAYREERGPAAQIAWLNGPENWPIGLLNGLSYSVGGTFKSQGREYYLEPADGYVLSLELLS